MSWRDRVRFRITTFARRRRTERDFEDELGFHLQESIDAHSARGLDPAAARRAALHDLGLVDAIKEDLREARGLHLLDALVQDVRYGLRLVHRNPGFAAAAIVTVALGIGATTAVFGVVDGVVLRPLPYPNPDRLVSLWSVSRSEGIQRSNVAAARYYDWREQSQSFDDVAMVRRIGNFNFTADGEPVRLQGARVTASLFDVLGVPPALGRAFRPDEERAGRDLVAILSDGLWTRRFARDPSVIGRTIVLNTQAYLIVGVMPPSFTYPSRDFELWVPLVIDPDEIRDRAPSNYVVVGRLKSGVSVAQAQAEMDAVAARVEAANGRGTRGVEVVSMLGDLVRNVRMPLLVLFAGAGSLLVIGCATLANLLIARASSRSHELVLRAALGARRGRLIRQSITELIPLMLAGGLLGFLLAWWMLRAALPWLPSTMPRVESIGIDVRVMAFSAALLGSIALVLGAWPALQVARWDISAALRESLRGASAALRGARLRDALVVAQIAAALLLVISATLLMRSFAGVMRIDPGFRAEGVATLHFAIPREKYPEGRQLAAICRDILERVQRLPGVDAAGMVNRLPLVGSTQIGMIELERSMAPANRIDNVDWRSATPDYFRALGIPLVAGRPFNDADREGAPIVGIIDEHIARLAWPGESAVGKRFRVPFGDSPWITIVGVVGHVRHDALTVDERPQVYWNYLQRAQDRMALVVRTRLDPDAIARSLVAEIRAVDPEQPVYDVRSMADVVDRSLSDRWVTTSVLGGFAIVALIMAAIGVYGVVAYAVGQRAREFGIRIALGASATEVLMLVLRQGGVLLAWGLAIGIAASLAATRLLAQMLHEVSRTDWVSFSAAVVVLSAAALVASLLPARRAASVDPTTVLRS
jgi:putative ABC transport system permease protein